MGFQVDSVKRFLKKRVRFGSPKVSLPLVLTVPFVAQVIGIVGLVGYMSYQSGQQAVENIANQLLENTGQQVNQELKQYLQSAHNVNQRHLAAIKSEVINLQNLGQLHRYLILQHRQIDNLTTFLFGTPQGDFRVSHRISPRDIGITTNLQAKELPFEVAITKSSNPSVIQVYSTDEAGGLGRYLTTINNIDVRDRPWYRLAVATQKPGWSKPFQIGSTNLLALNAFLPFYDKAQRLLGVFSVNISLNQLTDFLGTLKVGQKGKVFIMEANGLLIANSTAQPSYSVLGKPDLNGKAKPGTLKFSRFSADQISEPTIQNSYHFLKTKFNDLKILKTAQTLNFQFNGDRYFLNVRPYSDAYGLELLTVTVVPESDFTAQIQDNVRQTILWCGLALIASIITAILLANWITRPIIRLSKISDRMAKGEWQDSSDSDRPDREESAIAEIQTLFTSFNLMSEQLRQSLDQTSAELKEKAFWFNTLVETIPDPIFLKDGEGRWLIANHQALQLFEIEGIDYFGKTDIELAEISPFYHDAFLYCAETDRIAWEQKITRSEEQIPQADGSHRILDVFRVPLFSENGDRQGLVVIGRDISDRQQAEIALKQSETRFLDISNSSPSNIYIFVRRIDGSFYFEHMSRAVEPIHEISVEQVLESATILLDCIHPEDRGGYEAAVQFSMETLQAFHYEWRIITPSGNIKWLQGDSRPKLRDKGEIAWYGVVSDITDRKRIEQDLQLSEARLQAFLNNSPAIIFMKDLEGRYLLVNQEFERVLQTTQTEVLGKTDFDFLPPEVAKELRNNDTQTIFEQMAINFEETVTMSDGAHTYFVTKFPILDMDGKPYATGGISLDISDRKQVEIELAKAKDAAEAATMAKSEFLANMSHEIRTPMNGVLGIARLLSDTNLNGEQQNFVQIIQHSGDALLAIINDILDFSKIESGMLRLEAGEIVIEDILSSICKLLNSQAIEKQIELDYYISIDTPIALIGDSSRLRQILLNLIGNALKFTPSGSVSIAVSPKLISDTDKHELTFMVKDTGIGISSGRLNMLFRAFSQADTSISRKYGGTGLGLVISKSLVELMGGTIWVESLGNVGGNPPLNWLPILPTQGSAFYFTIVLSADDAIGSQSQKQPTLNTIDPQMAEKYPLRILLAEDNLVNQKVAIFTLKKLGYQVDVVNNGLEALNAVRQQTYDLVLMDVQMPEMDGLTATRLIRQHYGSQLRIVAMTANALPEDCQTCLDAGMDDYLSKPFNIQSLIRVFSNCDRDKLQGDNQLRQPQLPKPYQ
jgi:PAS domain S-box-containing protein